MEKPKTHICNHVVFCNNSKCDHAKKHSTQRGRYYGTGTRIEYREDQCCDSPLYFPDCMYSTVHIDSDTRMCLPVERSEDE